MSDKLGWIEPVFYGHVDGEPLGVFTPEQMDKMKSGYACPRCWQQFTVILTKCPVCQLDLTPNLDAQVREYPEDWAPGDDRKKQSI